MQVGLARGTLLNTDAYLGRRVMEDSPVGITDTPSFKLERTAKQIPRAKEVEEISYKTAAAKAATGY